MEHLLIVDDEPKMRESVARSLRLERYQVSEAKDGREAIDKLQQIGFDLLIMDLAMPRLDGLEAIKIIRQAGEQVPILVLTAKAGVDERVEGLEAGADDYLIKPFALKELLARVKALLRRAQSDDADLLRFSDLTLDTGTREAIRAGRYIELSRTEFNLLELLMRHPRQVLTRSKIMEDVWGYDFGSSSNSLDVYISYLRRKTEAGGEARLIQTAHGVGYLLKEE